VTEKQFDIEISHFVRNVIQSKAKNLIILVGQ